MYAKPLELNNSLVNRAAWKWLKKAKEWPNPDKPHLLTLAFWGMENGVEGDWTPRGREALEMQVGHLCGWSPEDVMGWMFENPDGPDDPEEQEDDLLMRLKLAKSPELAAAHVLTAIWYHQQALFPHLRKIHLRYA